MQHSDEHTDIQSYTLEQIQDLDNIDKTFKNLLIKALSGEGE